ncbi:MAG: hypothetical protein Q9180_005567, partial [Flavoplaca navasiana]
KEFQKKTKKDLSGDPRALRRLRTACERAKRTLSGGTQATVEIDSLFDGEDFTSNITRARFEDLNAKAFAGTMIPVQKVLEDANLDKSKIEDIVLVGGSTRIPKIQKLLSDFFDGKKLEKSINPDEAVAYGAAVQAGILSGKATSAETADLLLLDVVPLSLGVAMEGNIFAPVVSRGTTVPTLKKRTFTTVADNQQTVQFPVFQGERVNCEDNTSLGEFTLAPIPPMKAGDAVLEVVFEVDVNGILKVTATEKTSGRSANITISNSVGKLSSTEIENMVADAQKFKNSDDAFTKRFEARQQLESYISRVEEITSDPTMSLKMKRGTKEKIESALSDAMAQLEIEDSPSEELKKKELALKRLVTRAMSTRCLFSSVNETSEPLSTNTSIPHMFNRSLTNPSIFSTLTLTRVRQPFVPPSPLLSTAPCSTSLPNARLLNPPSQLFTTTPHPLKKQGGKGSSKNTLAINASKTASDNADPTDFSAFETEILKIVDNLRDEIRYIKAGGINVEAVEDARVVLKAGAGTKIQGRRVLQGRVRGPMKVAGGGGPKEVVRLRELCQVVPRGRMLVLLVGEKEVQFPISHSLFSHAAGKKAFYFRNFANVDSKSVQHIKPLTSALSNPPLSLTPLPPSTLSSTSSQQALEIHIPIPPTTGESRTAAINAVSAKGEAALFAVREARGVQKKRIRALDLAGKIGPDKQRTAVRDLDKVNERGVEMVKTVVLEKRRALGEG